MELTVAVEAGSHGRALFMKSQFGVLCDEFYASTRLHLKLELTLGRETVLHFFDRVRREYPRMQKLRRRDDGTLVLEEDDRDGESHRWLRLEPACLRFGQYSPPDSATYRRYAQFVLEQAPCHLTLNELDIDHLEVVYAFDLEYRGNHDQLVAETLYADHPLSAFLLGEDAMHSIECQPYLGVALTPACDVQAYIEVKSRTSTFEVRTGDYDTQILSVFSMVRKYWGFGEAADLAVVHNDLCRRADEIAGEKVVPILVNPLAQAIASRP